MKNYIKIATLLIIFTACCTLFLVSDVSAETIASEVTTNSGGDISWILVCTALVFIMVPGIALFYGGMLRKQSMSSMLAQSLLATCVMTISWVFVGYSLAFGGEGFLIGNLDHLFFEGMSETASSGISEMQFALFQMMFSIVTAVIILGACAERVRYTAIIWFLAIWSVAVYVPMAHWVWGGGMFDQLFTVLDFAGGTVVHICAGISGLAIVAFVGNRSKRVRESRAHNIPLVLLGSMLLWFGWIGFNGGSGLAADGVAVHAIITTQVSAACGMASWAFVQYMTVGRVSVLGLITGAVAGLVSITPGAAYMGVGLSMVTGLAGGVICFYAISIFRSKSKYDDALDAFSLHGVGGIWGAVATGLFANPALTGGVKGLFYGGTDLIVGQIASVLITCVFCFVVSYIIIWAISKIIRVRITEEEELVGQDLSEHGESAYTM